MFKKLNIMFIILTIFATTALAQARGPLTNVYSSWVSVAAGATTTTVTLPVTSRDLWVHNGSAIDICVSPEGNAFDDTVTFGHCRTTPTGEGFQLDGAETVYLSDFLTTAVTFRSAGAVASPVSVIATY